MASTGVRAQTHPLEFEGHKFTLDLPETYRLAASATPGPGVKSFGFATAPRSDGTRGVIQITVVDLLKAGAPAGEVTLEQFAATMAAGVRGRRTVWTQNDSTIDLDGVTARRIQWSGSVEVSPGGPTRIMRGIMIVGLKQGVAFALHTQDVAEVAASTLPICEKSLLSFSLNARK
jgi:hypothetical protein